MNTILLPCQIDLYLHINHAASVKPCLYVSHIVSLNSIMHESCLCSIKLFIYMIYAVTVWPLLMYKWPCNLISAVRLSSINTYVDELIMLARCPYILLWPYSYIVARSSYAWYGPTDGLVFLDSCIVQVLSCLGWINSWIGLVFGIGY